MKVLWVHPSVPVVDLMDYLTDAVRTPALEAASGSHADLVAYRGTATEADPVLISSWATTAQDAATFGPYVRTRGHHEVLAIAQHEDGLIEYVTKEPK